MDDLNDTMTEVFIELRKINENQEKILKHYDRKINTQEFAQKIITVSSRNKNYGENNNFNIDLDISDIRPTSVTLIGASIPKSWGLINDDTVSFVLSEDGNDVTLVLPQGNYGLASLKYQLTELLNNNSPLGYTYTVSSANKSIEPETGKLTIVVSDNGGIQPNFTFQDDLCAKIMGYTPGTFNFVANVMVTQHVINLQAEDIVHVVSDMVANKSQNLGVIFTNGQPSYSMINYVCPDIRGYSRMFSNSIINNANFKITDENGELLELHNIDVTFELLLWDNYMVDVK